MKISHFNILNNPHIKTSTNTVVNVLLSSNNTEANILLAKHIEKALRSRIEIEHDQEHEYCINNSYFDLEVNIFNNDISDLNSFRDLYNKFIDKSDIVHIRIEDICNDYLAGIYFIKMLQYSHKIVSLTSNMHLDNNFYVLMNKYNVNNNIINNESLTAVSIVDMILSKYNIIKIKKS